MRLKKIELVGFKSFCERTVVHFDESISAVVGPNGCGKSNIVDAIRWVLGERSAKHLRGQAMEDLIFAGSENRGSTGMAEVSLTLDLSDGVAPVRYLDYPEITVTRRLFRDGTSEYLIQKVPCRLKDITDIFLGTGVHTRAYSIIEQGRIGFILSAKPEERRVMIEEAAGITKYKRRKRSAEQRMQSTKQNLLRVNDIVAELEKRLNSLRRQARKAERYERYQNEYQELDLTRASHRYLEYRVTSGRVKAADEALQAESAAAQRKAEAAEGKLEAERLALTEAESALSAVQEQIYTVENKIKLLENQADFKTQERQRLEMESERSAEEINTLEESLALLDKEITSRGRELETIEEEAAENEKRLAAREEIVASVRDDIEDCRANLDDARTQASEHSSGVASCESRLSTGTRRLEDLEERIAQLDLDTESLQQEATVLEPQRGELAQRYEHQKKDLAETRKRKARLETHLDVLRERIQDSEVRLETARTQLHRCRSRLSSLKEIQARYEGFQRGTKAVMERYNGQSQQKGIRGLVADILQSPVEYEPAVEAVLGERLGNVLVEDQRVGIEAVEYLKEGQRGRSSFIPVQECKRATQGGERTRHGGVAGGVEAETHGAGVCGPLNQLVSVSEGYEEVADYLLGGVFVVEDLKQALRVYKEAGPFRSLVTLDGEVLDGQGVLTGGSMREEGDGILGQKREIRELEEMEQELEGVHHAALTRHLAVKTEINATQRELDLVVAGIHEADKALYACGRDLDTALEREQALERRLGELRRERTRLFEALETEREELAETRRRAQQHAESLRCLAEETRLYEARLAELTRLGEDASIAVTELKVAVAQSTERVEALRAQLDRARAQKENNTLRVETLNTTIAENNERRNVLGEEIAAARKEAMELSGQATEFDERQKEMRTACEAHHRTVGEMELQLKNLRETLSHLNAEKSETQMALQRLEMECAHLFEEVSKRHHKDLLSVLTDYHLCAPWSDEAQNRLDELERLLDRMRAYYNPTARREFEELTERHEFLTAQRADLEDALERLAKAIQKINRTSRKRFKETFEAVNERFQAVFPRLFNGGKASLVLTEADDILDAGVEIAAQPPGKKLQSVVLLSGGEKALTAVALIFAIFLHRPSPFCILDEVDAPLDEANVDRYNALVREIGLYTQFILITHNKRTMEMVDGLYGVTMDEPGVSRIVQVNLKEAARLAA